MQLSIGKMDRNGDGYISPQERALGIRKALFEINKRINVRNARNGYGYDECQFRRRPFMQNPYRNNQAVLSQFRMLAFFQQIMNNMMNMFRAMMNEQFNRQYGQYDDGNYPYGYCPQGTESIYDREVDPRTLIKGTPAQPKYTTAPVQQQCQEPAIARVKPTVSVDTPEPPLPQCGSQSTETPTVADSEHNKKVQAVIDAIDCDAPDSQKTTATATASVPGATATATATAAAQTGTANASATATATVTNNPNPYDGYCQDATSDAALYLQQDIADKDSQIANLEGIYQNGDYDRADGGQEKIEAEIQELFTRKTEIVQNIVPVDYKGDGQ